MQTILLELSQESRKKLAEEIATLVLDGLAAPAQSARELSADDLVTKQQLLSELEGKVTKGQLDYWFFHRGSNGLDRIVVKRGRRLFILRRNFYEWLTSRDPVRGQTKK